LRAATALLDEVEVEPEPENDGPATGLCTEMADMMAAALFAGLFGMLYFTTRPDLA